MKKAALVLVAKIVLVGLLCSVHGQQQQQQQQDVEQDEEERKIVDPVSLCSGIKCRAGRECRVLASGAPECVCKRSCPEPRRRRRPGVCGSDGAVYSSHCELHRQACVSGQKIRALRPHHHGGKRCLHDSIAYLKRMIQKAAEEVKQYEEDNIQVPASCHQNERNRMREFVISWMSLTAPKQEWFEKSMSYDAMAQEHFHASDVDGDGYLDSLEWLRYLNKNKKEPEDEDLDNQRLLCLDALVEEGDRDMDWRLSRVEFNKLIDQDYQPSNKYCVMDKKHYEDGTKTKVDCNGCVCSCGKWICTSNPCKATLNEDGYEDVKDDHRGEEEFSYDDMDNIVQ